MSPIQEAESAGTLRLAWNYRQVRKDNYVFWFMVVFWIIWAPVTVFMTCGIFLSGNPVFCVIWCIFGWLVTLAIPYALLGRYWFEWIEISSQAISHGFTGFLARKPKNFPLRTILELGFGRYPPNDRLEQESMVTLNILQIGRTWLPRREILGYWLAPAIKEQLFDAIEKFIVKNQIPLRLNRYGA